MEDDDYSDLVPGARVTHSVHGTTGTVADGAWRYGQVAVLFDGALEAGYYNPANLSTQP